MGQEIPPFGKGNLEGFLSFRMTHQRKDRLVD
jgi:hypothetical protein